MKKQNKDLSIGVELTDEELLAMTGGETFLGNTEQYQKDPIVYPLYGIYPVLKYGIQPMYGIKPGYEVKPMYGIDPTYT